MKISLARILAVFAVVISAWFFVDYGKDTYPFYGDAMGYYMYLPATFIYHNNDALDSLPADRHFDYTIRTYLTTIGKGPRTPKGYIISKYTYGVAALEMPFFLIAHGIEKVSGKEGSGYSGTYGMAIKLSSMFYALLGLILSYKILTTFFSKQLALTGTVLIFIGTNLFWFAIYQQGMAHVPLFFLYALLIYLTIILHQRPKLLLFGLLGCTAGLITVIRPTDIACLLIPLLYNVYSRESLREQLRFLRANFIGLLWMGLAFCVPIIPQLLYWKQYAGSFLYNSYGSEGFNWTHPRILDGMFSFANGWLAYTPLMALALVGLLLAKQFRHLALAIIVLLPVYIYVVYSWYCYNYINGFGSRPMIHLYALLAIPLVALLQYVATSKFVVKVVLGCVIFFCVGLNLAYSMQMIHGILLSEESNATYNMNMLFKMRATYNDLVMFDLQQKQPDEKAITKLTDLACQNYEDSVSGYYVKDTTGKSRFVYHMTGDSDYHPKKIWIVYDQKKFAGAKWIRCSGDFMCPQHYIYNKHIFTLLTLRRDSVTNWYGCKIDNKIGLCEGNVLPYEFTFGHADINKWGNVHFYVKMPNNLADGDRILLEIWNLARTDIYFDNICMSLYGNVIDSRGK